MTFKIIKGNGWDNNFISIDEYKYYLNKYPFIELSNYYNKFLPNCKYFYGDFSNFSDTLFNQQITGIFGFSPNGNLHFGHLSIILTYIRLGIGNIIFSSNDYEAKFIRNADTNSIYKYNNSIEILSKRIGEYFKIKTFFEVRSENEEIKKIYDNIKFLSNVSDIINVFGENIGEEKIKAMNWQAATYIYHSKDKNIIGISGIDEFMPMLRVDFVSKKLGINKYIGFFIKSQIYSLFDGKKMSKSLGEDFNINYKDTWENIDKKIDKLLNTKQGLKSLEEINFLIKGNNTISKIDKKIFKQELKDFLCKIDFLG